MTKLAKIVGLESKTTPEFRRRLVEIATNLALEPSWLAACIAFETAKSWSPSIVSGGGHYRGQQDAAKAVGLIQFTGVALRAMAARTREWSTTKAALAAMSAEEQLTWVERYFVTVGAKGRCRNVGDVYMAIFAPSAIGKPSTYPLYVSPTPEFTANRGLDGNRDGTITRGEATATVEYLLAQGKAAGEIEVAEGGAGEAGTFFPSGSDPVVGDELRQLRESVTNMHTNVLQRLDSMTADLKTLVSRG